MSKSRAPEVDADNLAAYLAAPDLKLWGLRNQFEQLDELTQAKKIPASFIAFEGMAALLGARIEGNCDAELKAYWPESWGPDEVTVPANLLAELSAAWIKYKEDALGRTFGEVLDLEGGGQGKKGLYRLKSRGISTASLGTRLQSFMSLPAKMAKDRHLMRQLKRSQQSMVSALLRSRLHTKNLGAGLLLS